MSAKKANQFTQTIPGFEIPSVKRTYISLFSSAGVGCYGFDKDKYDCIATNELLAARLNVQRANNKCPLDSGYICGDIRSSEVQKQIFREISNWAGLNKEYPVDVLFATPPCQGMSTANYKKTEDEQVRNSLVVEAIKIIKEVKPKIFIFENVRAFLKTICTDIDGKDKSIRESIWSNLSKDYLIYAKVINFKDYGVPSSRPRTLVIGTHRSFKNISPLNLFPTRQREITLRQAIGDLKPLSFSEKDPTDFLHFARPFPQYMIQWIENLKEGQSAFEQDAERIPYKINKEGERVTLKGSYMGNKYRRLFWDKPCACIATRNDQLASQDTIHPIDNRVLSIREIMRVMSVPDGFRWTKYDDILTTDDWDNYLKENELNIRRCLGEAVPTAIIKQIADKAYTMLEFEEFVDKYKDGQANEFLQDKKLCENFYIYTFLKEQVIDNAKDSGSFYTPQSVVFDALKDVVIDNSIIKVLEPSVGLGAFLPQLSALLSDAEKILVDAVEISDSAIFDLEYALQKISLGSNFKIELIHSDFLEFTPTYSYDLLVSNPPYAKADKKYPHISQGKHKTNNLFALFMLRYLELADEIVCIIPKNFVIASEYESIRKLYEIFPIVSICDFGVKYFKKVFVEIISIHFSKKYKGNLLVSNYLTDERYIHPQGYIFHDKLWLLYRNDWFDSYIKTLVLNVFDFFRDRQITNAHLKDDGKVWVIKSKNILDNGDVIHIPGYDKYLDDFEKFSISKFKDSNAIIMPNFTYNTRATHLPIGTIPNGSIAVLVPKTEFRDFDLSIYSTPEFRLYYAIIKSHSKFTINIDNSSIYYIGVPNGKV